MKFESIKYFGILKSKYFSPVYSSDILVPKGIKVINYFENVFSFNSGNLNLKILFDLKVRIIKFL
jgi:hypothetical protein